VLVFVDNAALGGRQDSVLHLCLRRQVLVKVGEVILDTWHVRRSQLFLHERVHVEIGEPRVCQDLVNAIGTKTLRSVLVEELHDEILRLGRHSDSVADGVREAHRALSDQEVHSVLVSVEEGWDTHDHLKNEDAKRPPIHSKVVTISDQHLWCQVLSSATE